jgi:hypothetical protein
MTDERDERDEVERLGHVDPPAPAVLDAAREILWSAVAAEILATGPSAGSKAAGSHREHESRETGA